MQGAYDYQFAPRWVVGGFVDADWSNVSGHAKQAGDSSIAFACDNPGNCGDQPVGSFAPSNGTIDTKVSTDWNISVGGRIGWLANQGTLLYLLAAYTHADLSDAQVKVSIPDPSDLVGVLLGGATRYQSFPQQRYEPLGEIAGFTRRMEPWRRSRSQTRWAVVLETRIPVDPPRRGLWSC